jgi:large subunit ribosomal protein L7Ae
MASLCPPPETKKGLSPRIITSFIANNRRLIETLLSITKSLSSQILLQRLTVPPALHQFDTTLDKNQAAELFKLLVKYQPETKDAKAARIEEVAKATAAGEAVPASVAPVVLKYGLKHVTHLIETKKAKLIAIAHDVNPIELVVWLPALCRKMDIPFCIVKGKARLGTLTNKKNAAVVAITKVNKEDESKLKTLQENFKSQFNDSPERRWGGGIMGLKTQAKLEKRRKQIEAEEAKKNAARNR